MAKGGGKTKVIGGAGASFMKLEKGAKGGKSKGGFGKKESKKK